VDEEVRTTVPGTEKRPPSLRPLEESEQHMLIILEFSTYSLLRKVTFQKPIATSAFQ